MVHLLFGGKKNEKWLDAAISEYLKRLRKPFDVQITIMDDEKLARHLEKWPYHRTTDFVILADERGHNLSSPDFSKQLQTRLAQGQNLTIIIGGAYGFSDAARAKADFLWSFSNLVFPHQIARLIAIEQIYRAYSISIGNNYHHE